MQKGGVFWMTLVCVATVSGAVRAEKLGVFSGVLEPNWNLIAVPFERARLPESWAENDLDVWRVSSGDSPATRLILSGDGSPQRPTLRKGGYWVYSGTAQAFEIQEVPGLGVEPQTAQESGWQFVASSADPNHSKVVGWDARTSAYVPVTALDTLDAGHYGYFGYKAETVTAAGETLSPQAVPLTQEVVSPWQNQPGQFESPASLDFSGGRGLLARSALSEHSGHILGHVAHVVRGDGEGRTDQIRYQRSEEAGRPGSFLEPIVWPLPSRGKTVRDMALAAKGPRVSIAWIAYEDSLGTGSLGQRSTLVVVQSHDGGRSFGQETVVRANHDWKRGLGIAYDDALNHHLVWGEANKAYYLKNLAGTPSNVFDDQIQMFLQEEAKYLIQEEPPSGKACACMDCWCEASEIVGGSSEAADGLWTYQFERYVVQPSIHVGDNQVHVVARQVRAWDPRPVPDPAWTGTQASPRYEEEGTQQGRHTIRRVAGWRKTWKPSYEPGDEALWDGLDGSFQYRYAGAWLEADRIMLAQRSLGPVSSHKKSSTVADSNSASGLNTWKVSSVASVGTGKGDNLPSYPRLAEAPWGLVLVYEDGVSADPNRNGYNAIRFQSSLDGGQSWSAEETLGTGYLPVVAVADTGDVQVLYYEPDSAQKGTIVSRARKGGQGSWSEASRINIRQAKPIHWKSHTDTSDGLEGGVSIAAHADLFLAAWIEQDDGQDRVTTARASRAAEAVGYSVTLPDRMTQGQNVAITVTAVNAYHMRVDNNEILQVKSVSSSGSQSVGSTGSNPENAVGEAENGLAFPVALHRGQVTFWADPTHLHIVGAAGEVLLAPTTLAEGLTVLEGAAGDLRPQFAPTVDGNYEKAKWLRDQLWRDGPSLLGEPTGYQVEYQPVQDSSDSGAQIAGSAHLAGNAEDATFLAQYERVWAYTQGIALAQYAQLNTPRAKARAQALARTVCAKAVRAFDSEREAFVIKGWPFSWNTLGDTWKDARLVTGATAWVIHGLGYFLLSEAFHALTSREQKVLRTCYHESLVGLEDHRRVVVTEAGDRFNLMTAGWTAQGLVYARSPWKLKGVSGAPLATENEVWDYYDVLDAIGYDELNPENIIRVARTDEDPNTGETRPLSPKILTEHHVQLLKKTVQAENVVTEHNLDVLSVLNHALNHASALGLDDVVHLAEWRDDIRNGIFQVLWDQDHIQWTVELEGALIRNATNPEKQADIRDALSRGDWGRVVTGGGLSRQSDGPDATFVFIPNRKNTAIDNCSWLSLSVDYDDLTNPRDIDALARCLEFTALAFSKDIAFQGKTYYGSHYFFDGFEDQYIEATDRQEQSFHLEATAGLIMGLLAFAEHHPQHEKSDFLGQEAVALWRGVQDFVIDHDFPYSSQRIIDLSTLLNSSTAIIWFIDVYEQFNRNSNSPLAETREPHPEFTPEPTVVIPPFGGAFLLGGQNISLEAGKTAGVQLSVLKWFLQLSAPQVAKEPAKAIIKTSLARSVSQTGVAHGSKSAGQVLLGEFILTGLAGTILGSEAANALLDFVNTYSPPTIHNIYVWTSPVPLDVLEGFKPVPADAFANAQEVQNMSLTEKALLAELALSPIDWSAPQTWGQDVMLLLDVPTDIIVQQSGQDVRLFYGPRTSNVGGYVVEVNPDGMRVIDRHTGETSEVFAEMSPLEQRALLLLPELIRAWILRAPEPSQRGLLEEYLSQWIFSSGATPLLPVRSSPGGIPVVGGTAGNTKENTDEPKTDASSIDLSDTPLSEFGSTDEEIEARMMEASPELLDALLETVPEEQEEAVSAFVQKARQNYAWSQYLKFRENQGRPPPPSVVAGRFYVQGSKKIFTKVSLSNLPTHPTLQREILATKTYYEWESFFDKNGDLQREDDGRFKFETVPIDGYVVEQAKTFVATEYRFYLPLQDGGRVIIEYLENPIVPPRTLEELARKIEKLPPKDKEEWDSVQEAIKAHNSVRYMAQLARGASPREIEMTIRESASDKKALKNEIKNFSNAMLFVKEGYDVESIVEAYGSIDETNQRQDELLRRFFGLSFAEFSHLE